MYKTDVKNFKDGFTLKEKQVKHLDLIDAPKQNNVFTKQKHSKTMCLLSRNTAKQCVY